MSGLRHISKPTFSQQQAEMGYQALGHGYMLDNVIAGDQLEMAQPLRLLPIQYIHLEEGDCKVWVVLPVDIGQLDQFRIDFDAYTLGSSLSCCDASTTVATPDIQEPLTFQGKSKLQQLIDCITATLVGGQSII